MTYEEKKKLNNVEKALEIIIEYCKKHDAGCTGCCFYGEYGCKLTEDIPEGWPEVI